MGTDVDDFDDGAVDEPPEPHPPATVAAASNAPTTRCLATCRAYPLPAGATLPGQWTLAVNFDGQWCQRVRRSVPQGQLGALTYSYTIR